MRLTDRLTLLRGGYSLKEIKAFEEEEAKIAEAEEKEKETQTQKATETKKETETTETEYAKTIKDLQNKLAEATQTLTELQKENREKDTGVETPDPIASFKTMMET